MGRRPKSREVGVKKQTEAFFSAASRSPGRGSSSKGKSDECLFSFQATLGLSLDEASGIESESHVVLIPHHAETEKIELFIGGKNLGEYKGSHSKKILRCIKENYIFEGSVQSIKKTPKGVKVQYRLEGKTR